jgi:hypothetical protein
LFLYQWNSQDEISVVKLKLNALQLAASTVMKECNATATIVIYFQAAARPGTGHLKSPQATFD